MTRSLLIFIALIVSPGLVLASSVGLVASYEVDFDDHQRKSDKTYDHIIKLIGLYKLSPQLAVFSAIGFSHQTLNEKVYRENDSDRFHGVSNISFGSIYRTKGYLPLIERHKFKAIASLPNSRVAQLDQHIATFSLTSALQSKSWKDFSLISELGFNYLWNQLKFSNFNQGTLNRDLVSAVEVGLSYEIYNDVRINYLLVVDNVRYLDGSSDNNSGNSMALEADYENYNFELALTNQAYPDSAFEALYYDKYKRLYTMQVSYVF